MSTATAISATITLNHPVKLTDGSLCSTLTMRRPTVKDMRIAQNSASTDMEKELRLVGNLCGLSPDDIDRLDFSDYAALQSQLQVFISPRKP